MATEIELPDGTILEAPDDADPSVVAKAYLARQRGPAGPNAATMRSERAMLARDRPPPRPLLTSPRELMDAAIGVADVGQSMLRGMVNYPTEHLIAGGLGALDPNDTAANYRQQFRAAVERGEGLVKSERLRTPQGEATAAGLGRVMSLTGLPQAMGWIGDQIQKVGGEEARHVAGAGAGVLSFGLPRLLGAAGKAPATAEDILARSGAGDSAGAASAAVDVSSITPDLRSAIERTGSRGVNNEVAARHIEADTLPVPIRLTRGEATQDAVTISNERNIRGAGNEIARRMEETNKRLAENLQTMRDTVGTDVFTTNAVEHGDTLIAAYKAKDAAASSAINDAYRAARDANGGDLPMDGAGFVTAADAALKKAMKGRYVPSEIAADLADIRETGAMNFETFENLRTNLAAEGRKADRSGDGNAVAAVNIVRDALENIEPLGRAAEVKPLFDRARGLARSRFNELDADPAYKAVVNETTPPDRFVQKFIIGAPRDQLATSMRTLGADPVARQTVSVAVLDYLRDAARLDPTYRGNFSSAGFARAVQALDPKANLIFDARTAENIGKLRNVAGYTTAQPRGSFVNNSNTLVGALAKPVLGNLPYVGGAARDITQRLQTRRLVNRSLVPGAGLDAPRGITKADLDKMRAQGLMD